MIAVGLQAGLQASCRHRRLPPHDACSLPPTAPVLHAGPAALPRLRPRTLRTAAAAASSSGSSGGVSWLDDGCMARPPANPSLQLINADLAPVPAEQRTFGTWDMTALWIGLVVSVSSWCASGVPGLPVSN